MSNTDIPADNTPNLKFGELVIDTFHGEAAQEAIKCLQHAGAYPDYGLLRDWLSHDSDVTRQQYVTITGEKKESIYVTDKTRFTSDLADYMPPVAADRPMGGALVSVWYAGEHTETWGDAAQAKNTAASDCFRDTLKKQPSDSKDSKEIRTSIPGPNVPSVLDIPQKPKYLSLKACPPTWSSL